MCRNLYSFVVYLYVNGSGSITSVGEEKATLSAVVFQCCTSICTCSSKPMAVSFRFRMYIFFKFSNSTKCNIINMGYLRNSFVLS